MSQELAPEYRYLLRAALLQGNKAERSWQDWLAASAWEEIGGESYPVLPSLFRNVAERENSHPLIGRLKGVYQKTWTQNHLLLRTVQPLLDSLVTADIQFIVLDSAAFLLHYATEVGLVPTPKVSLYVAPEDRNRYTELFNSWDVGAQTTPGMPDKSVLALAPEPVVNWQRHIIRSRMGGYPILDPTAQLYHTCVSGELGRTLQIACAYMLLKDYGKAIGWSKVGVWSRKNRSSLRVAGVLQDLVDVLEAPIPANFISTLQKSAHWTERIEATLVESSSRSAPHRLMRLYTHYQRTASGQVGFSRYLYRRIRSKLRHSQFRHL